MSVYPLSNFILKNENVNLTKRYFNVNDLKNKIKLVQRGKNKIKFLKITSFFLYD